MPTILTIPCNRTIATLQKVVNKVYIHRQYQTIVQIGEDFGPFGS